MNLTRSKGACEDTEFGESVTAAQWGAFACAFLAVAWFSIPTAASLHPRWLNFGYSHGYLILALTAVLLLKAIRKAPSLAFEPSIFGACLYLFSVLVIVAGHASTTGLLAQLALPTLWIGAIWTITGYRSGKRFFLPLSLLYFAIPVWDLINGLLQSVTVAVVSTWLRVASVPALIDGNMIHIPAGTFEVVGGCSGLHYLVVGLSLAAYLGLSRHELWSSRFALFALALVLGLFANWVRVFSVIVAGHTTDMQHFLVVKDHYYFGWALFLILCLLPLGLLDFRLQEAVPDGSNADSRLPRFSGIPRPDKPFYLSVLALVIFSGFGSWLQYRVIRVDPNLSIELSAPEISGWRVAGAWDGETKPIFSGADSVMALTLANEVDQLDLFVAAYAQQAQDREIVYFSTSPEGSAGQVISERILTGISLGESASLALLELTVRDRDDSVRLLWYARRIAGGWATSDLDAKLRQLLGALFGSRQAYALVLSAECEGTCQSAYTSLQQFMAVAGADIFGAELK